MEENSELYRDIHSQASKCDECGRTSPKLKVPTSDRDAKEDSNLLEKKQKCKACGKKFITLVALLFHKRTHHAVNPMKCSYCNRRFLTANRLEAHKASHDAKNCKRSLKCGDCDRQFLTATELETHKAFHIDENGESSMKCSSTFSRRPSMAGKSYTCKNLTGCNSNDLSTQRTGMRVKRSCTRPTCPCCNEEPSKSHRFRRQRKSHIGERQTKSNSQQQSTSNPTKITDNGCFSSNNSSQPEIHHKNPRSSRSRNKKSLDTRERPFRCDICYKSYLTHHHLLQHEKIHWGVKPFNCNICKRKFISKSILKTHKIIHTGLRPFTCDTCNQSFNRKFNLVRHLNRKHKRENVHICDICKKPTTNACYVAGHHQKRKGNQKEGRIKNGTTETQTKCNNGEAFPTPSTATSVNFKNQIQNGQLLDLVSHEEVKDDELHYELEATEPTGMTYICFECDAEFQLPWQLFKHCDEMHPSQQISNKLNHTM